MRSYQELRDEMRRLAGVYIAAVAEGDFLMEITAVTEAELVLDEMGMAGVNTKLMLMSFAA